MVACKNLYVIETPTNWFRKYSVPNRITTCSAKPNLKLDIYLNTNGAQVLRIERKRESHARFFVAERSMCAHNVGQYWLCDSAVI